MRIIDHIGNSYIPSTITKKLLFAHTCTGKAIWVDCVSSIRISDFERRFVVHVDEYIKRKGLWC